MNESGKKEETNSNKDQSVQDSKVGVKNNSDTSSNRRASYDYHTPIDISNFLDENEEQIVQFTPSKNPYEYLRVFDGSGNMKSQISVQTKSKHHKIVEEILANFDLEAVMDKYRGRPMAVSALRKPHLNEEATVGIQLTQWREKIRKLLEKESEKLAREEYQKLADAETKRLLKLRLEGHVTDTNEVMSKTRSRSDVSDNIFYKKGTDERYKSPNIHDMESKVLNMLRTVPKSYQHKTESESEGNTTSLETVEAENEGNKVQDSTAKRKQTYVRRDMLDLYNSEDVESMYRAAESLVSTKAVRSATQKQK